MMTTTHEDIKFANLRLTRHVLKQKYVVAQLHSTPYHAHNVKLQRAKRIAHIELDRLGFEPWRVGGCATIQVFSKDHPPEPNKHTFRCDVQDLTKGGYTVFDVPIRRLKIIAVLDGAEVASTYAAVRFGNTVAVPSEWVTSLNFGG